MDTASILNAAAEKVPADLLYLVKLADWAAGEGFSYVGDLIEDPDEWIYRKWRELGPPNGDDYSPEALTEALFATLRAAAVKAGGA